MSDLASLMVRRLTHDFAGPVGAITTAIDMGLGDDPELIGLVADGAAGLAAALKLYRFIATPDANEVSSGTARTLVADWLAARGGVELDWPGDAVWPAATARLTAGLAMLAAEARARRLSVSEGRVGFDGALPDDIAAVLGGAAATATRHAVAGLIAAQAATTGLALRVEPGSLRVYQASVLPR